MENMLVHVLFGRITTPAGHHHDFQEIFTSEERLEAYLANHPDVRKVEIAMFEVDPR